MTSPVEQRVFKRSPSEGEIAVADYPDYQAGVRYDEYPVSENPPLETSGIILKYIFGEWGCDLARGREGFRAFVNAVMNELSVSVEDREILYSLSKYQLLKNYSAPCT